MLTCHGSLNIESFSILDGNDRRVILAPCLPTWDDIQPPQYHKSPRLPHRLLRIPDTTPFAGELQVGRGLPQINIDLADPVPYIILPGENTSPITSAAWRFHWPVVCRGTCACVGVAIHPNTPDSPVDELLYLDLAAGLLNRSCGVSRVHSLPAADFTMTLTVSLTSPLLLKASLTYHFADLPPNSARTLQRVVWLGRSVAPSITLTPFISTAWGCAQVDMRFIGFLKPGVLELKTLCRFQILQQLINLIQSYNDGSHEVYDVFCEVDRLVRRLPASKFLRNQLRMFEYDVTDIFLNVNSFPK